MEMLWPTYDIEERCGSYADCDEVGEHLACNENIDACGRELLIANAKANEHNSKLEHCREGWSKVVTQQVHARFHCPQQENGHDNRKYNCDDDGQRHAHAGRIL